MASLLLAVIYLAFISLGLPDALLGSAWPLMYGEFAVPVSSAGLISMIIAGGTIVSSLFSDRLIRRFGTALVTLVSVGMTALALFGFSISRAFWHLCLWAIPYGLGGGQRRCGAEQFCGAALPLPPYELAALLLGHRRHRGPVYHGPLPHGRRHLARGVPLYRGDPGGAGGLSAVLAAALERAGQRAGCGRRRPPRPDPARHGAPAAGKARATAFFCYCALEATTGLWASSYLVLYRGVEAGMAAKYASLFYLGITLGRFFCGFVSDRWGDHNMVRLGQGIAGLGGLLLLLPLGGAAPLCALVALGLGCAPIYPSLLHATPANFGAENSQSIMGMQMACAYVGSTFMPPVFGWLAAGRACACIPCICFSSCC